MVLRAPWVQICFPLTVLKSRIQTSPKLSFQSIYLNKCFNGLFPTYKSFYNSSSLISQSSLKQISQPKYFHLKHYLHQLNVFHSTHCRLYTCITLWKITQLLGFSRKLKLSHFSTNLHQTGGPKDQTNKFQSPNNST